jgi:hypothetical protein
LFAIECRIDGAQEAFARRYANACMS